MYVNLIMWCVIMQQVTISGILYPFTMYNITISLYVYVYITSFS